MTRCDTGQPRDIQGLDTPTNLIYRGAGCAGRLIALAHRRLCFSNSTPIARLPSVPPSPSHRSPSAFVLTHTLRPLGIAIISLYSLSASLRFHSLYLSTCIRPLLLSFDRALPLRPFAFPAVLSCCLSPSRFPSLYLSPSCPNL